MNNAIKIALAGNPNSGKSTIFNKLTGAKQTVGNFPGVTVERYEGRTRFEGRDVSVVDNFEDRAVAKINDYMIRLEKEAVKELAARNLLKDDAWLIKDGSAASLGRRRRFATRLDFGKTRRTASFAVASKSTARRTQTAS